MIKVIIRLFHEQKAVSRGAVSRTATPSPPPAPQHCHLVAGLPSAADAASLRLYLQVSTQLQKLAPKEPAPAPAPAAADAAAQPVEGDAAADAAAEPTADADGDTNVSEAAPLLPEGERDGDAGSAAETAAEPATPPPEQLSDEDKAFLVRMLRLDFPVWAGCCQVARVSHADLTPWPNTVLALQQPSLGCIFPESSVRYCMFGQVRYKRLRSIISGELPVSLHLDFMHSHNHADLQILKNMKNATEVCVDLVADIMCCNPDRGIWTAALVPLHSMPRLHRQTQVQGAAASPQRQPFAFRLLLLQNGLLEITRHFPCRTATRWCTARSSLRTR